MALKKYLFDFDFDAPEKPVAMTFDAEGRLITDAPIEEEEAPPEEPPPPTYSEEELKLARDQAYESGRVDGAKAAQASAEQQLATAMMQIGTRMTELRDGIARSQEETVQFAVRVAATIARRAIPEIMRNGGADELTAMVTQCLTRVIDHPRVLVRCHDQMAEAMRSRLDEVAQNMGYEGRLVINGDSSLKPGDIKVEWTDGYAERDETKLWQEIDAAVAQAVGALLEPPPAQPVTETAEAAAENSEENGNA